MRFPFRSLRLRLSGFTAAVSFGIGGLALASVYVATLYRIRDLTMRTVILTQQPVEVNGQVVLLPKLAEAEIRTLESVIKEAILNQVALITLVVLAGMFILSVAVGWFVAGRALAPLDRIARVAEEIEATDLSRRIGLDGPDDELTRLARTFDAMLERLDRAFRSQRRFLAQTSHDLRTPLSVIRTNLDVLLSDPDTTVEDWRTAAQVAVGTVERMSVMIDDLLAAARLGIGSRPLVPVDLAEVAERVAEELRPRLEADGLTLSLDVRTVTVQGDADTLARAITNLLDNATKFSPPGSDLVVAVGSREDWGFVAVGDRGPGLAPEVVRGEAQAGQGLGLAIVREIASAHRGRVDATARRGGGTVVVIWVPVGTGRKGDPPSAEDLARL